MRKLARLLTLFLALQPALAAAQSAAPPNMPYHSVWGRLGAQPGDTGPGQSIPFAALGLAVNGGCSTSANGLVPPTGGGTSNFLRADCTFANPLSSISNNTISANIAGGPASPIGNTPTSIWDSFCSTTVGNFWVRQTGGWGCTSAGYANPVWWGADPTGTADSASAINSALATGLPVRFPPGTFKINSLITYTLPNGYGCFCVSGAGQNVTTLNWPNASGGFTVNAASLLNNFDVRGLHLTTSQVGSGTALNLLGVGSAGNPWSSIDDVFISGADFHPGGPLTQYWATGINLFNWGDVNILRTNTNGPSTGGGIGLVYGGNAATTSFATVLNVALSAFNFQAAGINLKNYWQGVTISYINCNGGVGGPCIQQSGSATGVLALLQVNNIQSNTAGNQIDINTGIDTVTINNNTLTCLTNNCIGLNLNVSFGVLVTGNIFNLTGTATGTVGMVGAGQNATVTGNLFSALSVGVNANSASSLWTVGLNTYNAITSAKTVNNGTNNSFGTAAAGNMAGIVP